MGSCTHIVDDSKVLNEYEYDAWGNIASQKETVKNRFKFNGQQLDPITQQYYLRARFYNPIIARFTQEDTYRGDGLNLYAYCANNPVYYVDPSGNDGCPNKSSKLSQERQEKNDSKRQTPDQKALLDLAKEAAKAAKSGNPISEADAKILDEWAEEYGVPQHHQAYFGSGKHFKGGNYLDHTHIFNVHVPYVYK